MSNDLTHEELMRLHHIFSEDDFRRYISMYENNEITYRQLFGEADLQERMEADRIRQAFADANDIDVRELENDDEDEDW